eukprot:366390-Chlamydomonas_euryale.AAC.4
MTYKLCSRSVQMPSRITAGHCSHRQSLSPSVNPQGVHCKASRLTSPSSKLHAQDKPGREVGCRSGRQTPVLV